MTDIPLNELGKTQATYAKEALRDVHINAAYASPLQRAVETAQIILESHETDLIIENELHEQNAGDWEGLTAQEIEERFPGQHDIWTYKPTEVRIQNGERFQDVQTRATAAFWEIARNNPGETVLIVAHMVVNISLARDPSSEGEKEFPYVIHHFLLSEQCTAVHWICRGVSVRGRFLIIRLVPVSYGFIKLTDTPKNAKI